MGSNYLVYFYGIMEQDKKSAHSHFTTVRLASLINWIFKFKHFKFGNRPLVVEPDTEDHVNFGVVSFIQTRGSSSEKFDKKE